MKWCSDTNNRQWELKLTRKWDGKGLNFEFKIRGKADSNFATSKETRKSITGYCVWLEDLLVGVKSDMKKIVTLSVTEAEVIAMVQCVQEMICVIRSLMKDDWHKRLNYILMTIARIQNKCEDKKK